MFVALSGVNPFYQKNLSNEMNIPMKSFTGLFTALFQDGPAYWFDFLNINHSDEDAAKASFEIPLIINYGAGTPHIQLSKQANAYYYIPEKKQLTYVDDIIGSQLEEIWQNAKQVHQSEDSAQLPKWKSIEATVVQDQQKPGKAYLVQQIQFF